ncbi:MAG: TonB-dependent receptor [Saprospiraceae bacterium]|nr:TonB-dependent receptor [Saprospiraceae bacterium]MDW8484872.1 TonB-dependent receptor [Saprospiraceae bacterium]
MKSVFTFICLLWSLNIVAQRGTVSGKVTDQANNEPLPGAAVVVDGATASATTGAITQADGSYSLSLPAGNYTLLFSFIGYETKTMPVRVEAGRTVTLDVSLAESGIQGHEVVVSVNRRAEKRTNAPATISVINARAIAELPSFNVAELLGRQKGVDYVRSGVLGIGINARGFNSAFNPKNLQINDNRLSALIATGLPLGALSTTVKEDIERIEVILGPSSALYGPNAHNGLLNTITKDPRTSEGTTLVFGAGNQKVLTGRLRHAMKLGDKFAFKISGEYTQGEEFEFTDTVYILSATAPGGAIALPEYLLDRRFNSLRGEAQVYYSVNKTSDIIIGYGASNSNNIGNTNAGRNQIRDWRVSWLQARYVSPRLFLNVYNTWSTTDSTIAMNQRTVNYFSYKANGFSEEEARNRSLATQYLPLSATTGIHLPRGALFQDYSQRLNAEVQYNNTLVRLLDFIVGVQYQRDRANSRQTYLLDKAGPIIINQIGGYLQLERKFGPVRAVVAARADNHELYGFNFIPKAALVYATDNSALRLTYGEGIAAPTILNLSANIFGGLLLGNGEGFTIKEVDVTTNTVVGQFQVPRLQVERIRTLELGYKGQLNKRIYVDANAYFNRSQNFLSPAINVATDRELFDHDGNPNTPRIPRIRGYGVRRGNQPIGEIAAVTSLPDGDRGADIVLTYVNFGKVNTYGFDLGLNVNLAKGLSGTLNYSWFGYDLDKNDPSNDGNRNGVVDENDLPINTPTHKIGAGLNYVRGGFFSNIFGRWYNAYDFFSGINVAARTNPNLIYAGSPVIEGRRVGRSFNYGPLGGLLNLDISAGYTFKERYTLSAQVVNALGVEIREFVASPPIGRLYSVELKVHLPSFSKR